MNDFFKLIRKDDFFRIIDINPNMVFVKNTVEINGKKEIIDFHLTKSKMIRRYGSTCSCCEIEGRYFTLYNNGDIKLFAVSEFGKELEITLHGNKLLCSFCKDLKNSILNRLMK